MNDFLVKPFRMAEMAGIVARWLHGRVTAAGPSEAPGVGAARRDCGTGPRHELGRALARSARRRFRRHRPSGPGMTFRGLLQLRPPTKTMARRRSEWQRTPSRGWCRASARRALGVGGRRRTGRSTTAAGRGRETAGRDRRRSRGGGKGARSAARLTPADAGAWSGPAVSFRRPCGPLRNRLGGGRDVCLRQFDGLAGALAEAVVGRICGIDGRFHRGDREFGACGAALAVCSRCWRAACSSLRRCVPPPRWPVRRSAQQFPRRCADRRECRQLRARAGGLQRQQFLGILGAQHVLALVDRGFDCEATSLDVQPESRSRLSEPRRPRVNAVSKLAFWPECRLLTMADMWAPFLKPILAAMLRCTISVYRPARGSQAGNVALQQQCLRLPARGP